jgi:DNA-binding transcriptional ArsR family regulator
MTTSNDRLTELERRLAAVEERLAGAPPSTDAATGSVAPDTFWALDGLTARMSDGGAVLIVGNVTFPDGRCARWQEGLATTDLLDDDWERAADLLAALGHPVRIRLVREVLRAPSTARDLATLDGVGTSGQIYHHLRQLVSAGWLRARGGGQYEVPAERVVPLLTTVLGGRR